MPKNTASSDYAHEAVGEKTTRFTWAAGIDGRWISAGVVTGFLIAVYIAGTRTDFVSAWARVGVEHLIPPFADMRFLTSAVETHRAGGDPFVFSPFDPWLRPLNYPRVWLLLSGIGITANQTIMLALILAAAFYTATALLVGRTTVIEGLVYGVLLCSPPAMFAVERGNVDLLIFTLLAVAALVFAYKAGVYWSYVLVLLAAVLKLYPICGFAIGLQERRRRGILLLWLGLAAFALYAFCIRSDITHVIANTPQIKEISFGHRVLFEKLASMKIPVPIEAASKIAVVACVVLALVASRLLRLPELSSVRGTAMVIGAAIYVGTFVAMNNFNYRLIFLFFLLPQLFAWGTRNGPYRWVGRTLVVMITGAMLLASARYPKFFITKEILNWIVFVFSVFILIGLTRKERSALLAPEVASDALAPGSSTNPGA